VWRSKPFMTLLGGVARQIRPTGRGAMRRILESCQNELRVITDWRWGDISGATTYVTRILERKERRRDLGKAVLRHSCHRGTIFPRKGIVYIKTLISWRTSYLEFSSCQHIFRSYTSQYKLTLLSLRSYDLSSSLLSSYTLAYRLHKPWFQQVYP
jgi:hypothetical protein